jgi:hypothetical protein
MSRSRIIILALPFACLANGLAQREAVIDELLRPILTASAADPNVEAWNWEKNRNGGYLLRTTIDVTGDGQPEVFIASTLHSSRREHYWKIFDVADDGTMRPYEKGLNFSFAWPMIENNKVSLVYMAGANRDRMQAGEEKYLSVSRFVFNFPEISETTTYVSEDEEIKLQPADHGEFPKLQAILLADYLTNPDAKWSDVTELKLDASDSYYLEEDKERAEKNTAFTPQVALSQLGMGQPTSKGSEDQTGAHQSEQANPPFIPQQSAPRKPTDQKPATSPPVEEPSSSTRWLVLAAVIVAALGLLWVLLKKRK